MKMGRMLAMLGALSLAVSCFSACASNHKTPSLPSEPDTFVEAGPVDPIPEIKDSKSLLDALLADVNEADAADFSWKEVEGGVEITQYLGTATQLRVPAIIDGKSVVGIGTNVFRDNQTLTLLALPDSVTSFGLSVLEGCTSLKTLRTPVLGQDREGKSYLGYLFGAESYEDNPLKVPPSLKNLSLGASGGELPDFALYDCNDLAVVLLEESVQTLGAYSFYNCASLEWINTDGLRSVGEGAFHSCAALLSLRFGNALSHLGFSSLEGCAALRELTIPFAGESCTENTYLAYVFGASAPDFAAGFYPRHLTRVEITEPCATLGNYAFFECASLAEIILPGTLTHIGIRAFYGCTNLRGAEIPATVTAIGENAFFGCSNLRELSFGENSVLQTLGINAFYGCRTLTQVDLPRALQSIPASCFADCKKLRSVSLGGVSSVGKNAFRGCDSLTFVGVYGDVSFAEGNEKASAVVRYLA